MGIPSANDDELTLSSALWAIFLQYPVLSYLDSQRKRALIEAIFNIATLGAMDGELDGLIVNDFCIANVTHYSVADYEES